MPRGEKRGVKGDGVGARGGGRAPPEDVVRGAILSVLKESRHIRSQERFLSLVEDHLKRINGRWGISTRRLRKIAASTPGVRILTHCRISRSGVMNNKCPVCGEAMKPVKNETLYGWKVTSGYSCPKCGYWTGRRRRIPILYEFLYEVDD